MITAIIRFSVQNKLIISLLVLGLVIGGILAMLRLPVDAVPDITNNQVQVVTVSEALAPQEVEQYITYPVEVAMSNIPDVIEIRSISRYGLSVVTIVFEDRVPVMRARQFVKEQIDAARSEIPAKLGIPELMPITTGLGEIYQYILEVEEGFENRYGPMELRTIQDWIVKRQLAGIKGIIEISSFGGYLKQYEVSIDPLKMRRSGITIPEVYDALSMNNQNTGGSYIEKDHNAYYIRSEGVVKNATDIGHIVVRVVNEKPVLIRDIADVRLGSPKRFGAMTMDGKGEAVGGITLMLKGGNSSEAIRNVHERMEQVVTSLPEGINLYPYLDRSVLVDKTIRTVKTNLLEGGLIVILILILLLGDLRAGLIVSSVIPLSMMFAMIMMRAFGVSANLMSLGAIDFGIVVDGAVIVVEGVLHMLVATYAGRQLSQMEMDGLVTESASKLFRSAVFGVFIILVVFIPIMTLSGIEGKMFRPMAQTFSFAILGSLLLSLTYVPMMASLFLKKKVRQHKTWADRILVLISGMYLPALMHSLRRPYLVLVLVLALFIASIPVFKNLGAEFIPTLEEGDLAMQMAIQPGSSLEESIRSSTKAELLLLEHFPEVRHVVSKIGTAEVPTDPMAIEDADIMIILKEKDEWTSASTRDELADRMKEVLAVVPGTSFEFTQPIQLRFNELMTGAKTDISVKIFGENTEELKRLADRAASLIRDVRGAGDVKVDQTEGLPQLKIRYDRQRIARHGVQIEDLNVIIRTAYAGEVAGVVFENERKFDLVLRLNPSSREELDLNQLFIENHKGIAIPLSQLANIDYEEGPMQISRESARRFINVGVNVRNRDVAGVVSDIDQVLGASFDLPPGYYLQYGGQFENLQAAQARLRLAVPAALVLIFVLLYFTFGKLKYALLIITTVPMSAIGGVAALWIRGMPFSISSGVGFIALFGVAVLNGIVMISYFNRLRYEGGLTDVKQVIIKGGLARLRPVLITATVATLGFVPMALSTSNGAEVQRPLATVVIGGLIIATILTLIVLPVLYYVVNKNIKPKSMNSLKIPVLSLFILLGMNACQKPQEVEDSNTPEVTSNVTEGIRWSEDKIRMAGLVMGSPEKRKMPVYIHCTGIVEVPPQSKHTIHAPAKGYVKSAKQYQGQYVRNGTYLTSLSHPDLIRLQREYLESSERASFMQTVLERKTMLAESHAGAIREQEEARVEYEIEKIRVDALAAELRLIGFDPERLTGGHEISTSIGIHAPVSGYLHRIFINPGKLVDPEEPMYEMIDPDHLHLDMHVYSNDLRKLKKGQRIEAFAAGATDSSYAEVFLIDPIVDPDAGTASVHGHFLDGSYRPDPGTFLQVRIRTEEVEKWTLPSSAIVREGNTTYIYLNRDGQFFKHPITVTSQSSSHVAFEWDEELRDKQMVLEGAYYLSANGE